MQARQHDNVSHLPQTDDHCSASSAIFFPWNCSPQCVMHCMWCLNHSTSSTWLASPFVHTITLFLPLVPPHKDCLAQVWRCCRQLFSQQALLFHPSYCFSFFFFILSDLSSPSLITSLSLQENVLHCYDHLLVLRTRQLLGETFAVIMHSLWKKPFVWVWSFAKLLIAYSNFAEVLFFQIWSCFFTS